MKSNFFSSSSILRKFLVFNLIVFLVLGMFTFLYLKAIKPNLVVDRSTQHLEIIKNTTDHINRLNIEFTKESITEFLLGARFLFQNLDRVQLYDLNSNLLADTDTLDLAQNIFVVSFSGRDVPPHSHSSCEGSNTSFPCLIRFFVSSILLVLFLN